ncbi:hypothetical protein ABZT49_06940, partial [Methylobacterium sp. EM32]|uniref:hypothetical protein n=1 Tax=Methylobacterium sp. EM32 TaxID=3163481 RepID=UPI0033B5979E
RRGVSRVGGETRIMASSSKLATVIALRDGFDVSTSSCNELLRNAGHPPRQRYWFPILEQ